MALTIGITKDVTINAVNLPNAFATLAISHLVGNKFSCQLLVYKDQSTQQSDPTNHIKRLSFEVTLNATQTETITNTLYTLLIAQVPILNGATPVT